MLAHVLIGMVIGGMVSLREGAASGTSGPLALALAERIFRLGEAFRRVVFAQVRISALNTLFTALYLGALLPLFGVNLPLTKTMIVVTFIAGLLPVVGNLISNTVIVVVSASVSFSAALASLVFLVALHKGEYFLSAKILGHQVSARAWEMLLAMLVMEAAFGVPGIAVAPVYYAYMRAELMRADLV